MHYHLWLFNEDTDGQARTLRRVDPPIPTRRQANGRLARRAQGTSKPARQTGMVLQCREAACLLKVEELAHKAVRQGEADDDAGARAELDEMLRQIRSRRQTASDD